MASAIHPDKSGNLPGNPAGGPQPAKANPLRHKRTPPKPAAAKPAAAEPTAPPIVADREPDDRGRPALAGMLRQTPAWVVSILVHVVALLAMALFVTEAPEKQVAVSIFSSASDSDEPVAEFSDELPTETPEIQSDATEEPVPDQPVVVDPGVISDASDATAAPLAVDTSAFGDFSAPASDLLGSVTGAVGGKDFGGGFGKRGNPGQAAAKGGGGPQTEGAVDRALKWFIEHQLPDGGWSLDLKKVPKCNCANEIESAIAKHEGDRCAATAMAVLPFLGRGYTHRDGDYKKEVGRGLAFLTDLTMKNNGRAGMADHKPGYSQGIVGIVLAEAYGMTRDEQLLLPAQAALDAIAAWQHPETGGWEYLPYRPDRPNLYPGDTSVAAWNIMAMKSGQMAGLKVDPAVLKKAAKFLDSVAAENGAKYYYKKGQMDRLKPAVSSAGLLGRMYLGMKRDHPGLQNGVLFLSSQSKAYLNNAYFNYYTTQIMHHVQGPAWDAWNTQMQASLLPAQATTGHAKGSWQEGVADAAWDKQAGRLYATSLCTLMLEVYYRHMSIYDTKSTGGEFKD